MKEIKFKKESGAALIVGLIMLLVMTIVGLAGMSETIMEEKMLFNFRDRAIALHAADSSLRASEAWLGNQTLKPTPETASNCSTPPLCGNTDNIVWDTGQMGTTWATRPWTWWTTNGVSYNGSMGYISDQPRSVIEFRSFNEATNTTTKGIASNLNAERASLGIGWHYYNFISASPGYRAETLAIVETTFKKWY